MDGMLEMERILREHGARYPLMQPEDGVKLIYQNVFGGGHLIRDEVSCLAYLRREYEAVAAVSAPIRREPIGNGVIRVYLAELDGAALDRLGEAFLRSAREHVGTREQFLRKLEILRRLTAEGVFTFDSERLETYLRDYAEAGYPMVSHSETYRAAYAPAYRVVLEQYFL